MPRKRRKVMDIIEAHFSKRYSFKRDVTSWILPSVDSTYCCNGSNWLDDEQLTALKEQLNRVKDQLSNLDIVRWREHTQNVNLAGFVVPHLKATIKPELCTQAWCKFYEVLCSYHLIGSAAGDDTVRSVHLCEAPGAFVAALNHFLKLNHPDKKLSWLATTLNPYYEGNRLGETIPDDRFIFPTLSNWDFGRDNTGNIFSASNRLCLIERAQSCGQVHLVTADGSIDCQDDPSEQERIVSRLHLAETIAALRLLSTDGAFVLKMFTCFEHSSICLLYLLNCTFREVHVCKPGTSKKGNSELYVVCLGYCGSISILNHLAALDAHLDDDGTVSNECSMFSKDSIPDSFLQQITACCKYFVDLQIEAIEYNLLRFNFSEERDFRNNKTKSLVSREFVRRFGIVSIPSDKTLVRSNKLKPRGEMYRPLRVGSYNERRCRSRLPWKLRLNGYEQDLKVSSSDVNAVRADVFFGSYGNSSTDETNVKINIVIGHTFERCLSSSFCALSLLKIYNDVCDCAREANCTTLSMNENNFDALLSLQLQGCYHAVDESGTLLAAKLNQCVASGDSSELSSRIFVGSLVSRIGTLSNDFCDSSRVIDQLRRLCLHINHLNNELEGSLMLVVDPPLSRVSAGVLYLLWQTFGNLSLSSVFIDGLQFEFAICKKSAEIGANLDFVRQLEEMFDTLDLKDGEAIMEIIPIRLLLGGVFYDKIRSFTDKCLAMRSFHLIRCLKLLPDDTA